MRAEKPFLCRWSDRASSELREVKSEREVRNRNVRAEGVSGFGERLCGQDSSEEGQTEAATGRLVYILFLGGPVSLSNWEGHGSVQPVLV